ncbi:MAG: nickel-responsive transcriptional regulator NikR [Kiritimatiellae bacterium]|jgi:CopG family nickel-responsive transcriptional regulator|nr:nickel-responsive transcriptional regulator NikR [Kiritimatiellia bacterium]
MGLVRFSISLDGDLLAKFDRKVKSERCPTRSKAVGDLIRKTLVEEEWFRGGGKVAGAIVLVYDHHKPDLVAKLTDAQHASHHAIISTQHIHLDHDNCLEIVAVLGKPPEIDAVIKRIRAIKGIKHVSFAAATTGKSLS